MGKAMPGDRALFGLMPDHPDGHAGEYLFRCPTCDHVAASAPDTACGACTKNAAKKKTPAKPRRRTATGGDRR